MHIPTEPIGSIPQPFHLQPDQRVFVGVVSPIRPEVETPEEVRDRVLPAARILEGR